ncbi:MAG: hypothetical protein IJ391_08280 [Clostridia bacterium]|nr:hypothetical protein [Clostridia bacterium]
MPDLRLNCSLSIPYPDVNSADLNRYDTQMIRTLLARKLRTINEYITQSVVLAHDYGALADIIDCIAVIETRHFKLLGRLLLLSGESVGVQSLAQSFNGRSARNQNGRVNKLPLAFINANLESERASASDYRLVLSQVHDASAKALLERILADEEHHADIFANLRSRYS